MAYADKFTVTSLKTERYSDFYTNLDKNFGSGDVAKLTNEDSIISSLKNIIFTNKGERPFFPEFGCNLRGLLFENFSEFTAKSIQSEIETAIQNFEPRVRTLNTTVVDNSDRNAVSLYLYFTTINSSETVSVNFLLSRIR